jgi:hypothetical protein
VFSFVIASGAKRSSVQCKRPLDCFVADAPCNDEQSRSRDALRARVVVTPAMESDERFALGTDLRQMTLAVVAGAVTI